MHLGHRGGRDRLAELHEGLGERAVEGGLDDADRDRAWKRRNAVLQALEISDRGRPDEIGTRRQELAELHVGWPETTHSDAEAIAGRRHPWPRDHLCHGKRQARLDRHGAGIDAREDALARQDEAGPRQAPDMAQRGQHRFRASKPNGSSRRRPCAAWPKRAESRPRRSCPRNSRRRENGGSTPRGSDRARRLPRRVCPWPG